MRERQRSVRAVLEAAPAAPPDLGREVGPAGARMLLQLSHLQAMQCLLLLCTPARWQIVSSTGGPMPRLNGT